ncbi:MAG: ribosomal RNA small subunit methyltransferase A [Acidobacteria bacterium]|nr:ribosomal RNA small subunit methyltransferase A [Acidobacteriota bacterium]
MSDPRLKKRFGQHHLTRPELCRPLLRFLRPDGRPVVEVGPGGGILTKLLLQEGGKVLALELDPEWAFALGDCVEEGGLALAVADAMQVCWRRVPTGALVAGNLPYEIASALIRRLLPLHGRIARLGFLVQREVAERFVARPGSKSYGLLSVLAAAWSDVELLGTVARGSFRPLPKVQGAFIGFRLKPPPIPEAEMPAFVETVELAFSQRRKTLRNALASRWGRERAEEVLAAVGVDKLTRAEQIPLETLLRIEGARRSAERSARKWDDGE